MPVDIFPEIDIPVVSVVWTYNGMSAQDIQNRILSLRERQLSRAQRGPGVPYRRLRSALRWDDINLGRESSATAEAIPNAPTTTPKSRQFIASGSPEGSIASAPTPVCRQRQPYEIGCRKELQ